MSKKAVSTRRALPSTRQSRSLSFTQSGLWGLGGGGLGLGCNDPLLVKSLEERLDDGTVGDYEHPKKGGSVQIRK
jgi:hypothetical protein